MLDIGIAEFLVIGAVALLVVGPKELPALMARLGRWMGKARAMARHARAGFDAMVREAEIEEMNKRWEAENARIMAMTQGQSFPDPAPPQPDIIDPPPAASTTPLAPMAEADSVLPGADGDAGDPHAWKRPAGATTATAGAAPALAGSATTAAQGTTAAPDAPTPDDPTDWRDPPTAAPVMRPLAGPPPGSSAAAAGQPAAALPAAPPPAQAMPLASPPAGALPAAQPPAMLPLDLPPAVATAPSAPGAATAATAATPASTAAPPPTAGATPPPRPARRRKPAMPAPPAA
jgi:sec-independent protein translocase protein TatB